jgi:hypothetical protein
MSHPPKRILRDTLRPFYNRTNIKLAMPETLVTRIDRWWHQNKLPNRSEAIRLLIERGLSLGKLESAVSPQKGLKASKKTTE